MATSVLWFRRDLRLADQPALHAALGDGDDVVPLFVLDPRLEKAAGSPRLAFLDGCLAELHERTGGALVVRRGDPAVEVAAVAREVEAGAVHATTAFGPYGAARDASVADALDGRLELVDSPYAVAPGRVRTATGTPYRVFTPWARAWAAEWHGRPLGEPADPRWATGVRSEPLPDRTDDRILPPGEQAGLARLRAFRAGALDGYATRRDVPGEDGTSRLSVYLKYGCIHPRQCLEGLGRGQDADRFRTELAWREFYADVVHHRPESLWGALRPEIAYDTGRDADARFDAWATGRTGYPIVDAGMRQLLGEAWMHNRVRMIVASFLVKDLHLDWRRGARHFLEHLQDGDVASNNHGWQWVAGTGTDPAPFHRVFNPVRQGRTFDPDGSYVRRWVPELRDVVGDIHEPRSPIVDHAEERREALRRFAEAGAR